LTEDERISGGFETTTGDIHIVASPTSYNDGNWHQAVLTFNESNHTLNLHIDGIRVTNNTINSGIKPDTTGNTPIRLGASTLSEGINTVGGFIGKLDDFTVWDVASTNDQVIDLFNKESKLSR
jgi:hypothetical protein